MATYYEQLVRRADSAMKRHPGRVIALDAQTFHIISCDRNVAKVTADVENAALLGKTPVIIEKNRKPETWIF
jgi:hypothetical protein